MRKVIWSPWLYSYLLVAGALSLSVWSPPARAQNADTGTESPALEIREVKDAIVQFRSGNFKGARDLLVEAHKQNASISPPDVIMAQFFMAANQLAAAQNSLEEGVKNNPDDPDAYLNIGSLALRTGRLTEAGLIYRQALALSEKFSGDAGRKKDMLKRAHIGMAAVAEVREKWADAEKHLRSWIEMETVPANVSRARRQLGTALFNQKQQKKAMDEFVSLYEQDKTVPRPEINIGLLFERDGDKKRAETYMLQAAEKDGKNLQTRLTVAQWALRAEKLDVAAQNAKAALDIDPDSPDANFVSGLVARYREQYDEAAKFFGAAHVSSPSNSVVNNQLALVLIEQKDEAKRRLALDYAQLNARVNDELSQQPGREARITLGWVLHKLDRKAESRNAVQQSLASGPVGPESGYHAAFIMADTGNTAVATDLLQKALEAGNFAGRKAAQELKTKLGGG